MRFKSSFKLILRYLKYFFKARHSSGHGIHSPFIFNFATGVLFSKDDDRRYFAINDYRKQLLRNQKKIEIDDKGAGSLTEKKKNREIYEIARNSAIKKKFGRLLARIVDYYKPSTLIELGTCLGISSGYLGFKMQKSSKLFTIEGDIALYNIAKEYFDGFHDTKIYPLYGEFDLVLPELLNNLNSIDLVFFDGNHRKEPTIKYFELCLNRISNDSIFIFDDIHWSDEMEEAWEYIKSHSKTRVCIDLFQFGVVFFRKELSCENFTIRF